MNCVDKNPRPLVSIITVVFNGESYIDQTINSVLSQTYDNIEYIIVDGGSTDGTRDIVRGYEASISCFISESDDGLYDAMNKGIELANGVLIGMINSDDWYELNTVELMVDSYVNNPTKTIFHADRYDIDEEGGRCIRRFNASIFKFKYYGMTYNHPSMFIAKEEYAIHKYNKELSTLADYQFVLEAFVRDRNTFYYIDKPLVNYRLDGLSSKVSIVSALKQGLVATKTAGYGHFDAMLSFSVRLFMFLTYRNALKLRTLIRGD